MGTLYITATPLQAAIHQVIKDKILIFAPYTLPTTTKRQLEVVQNSLLFSI